MREYMSDCRCTYMGVIISRNFDWYIESIGRHTELSTENNTMVRSNAISTHNNVRRYWLILFSIGAEACMLM